ncbi:MAG: CarD family transcriptional regulator [Oscillospiraceae bacterium]|nr:CarD family transcriptional regulator [Oscillospiraceae bacterium]
MDFKKDDCVVYKSAGVCRVLNVEPQSMDGENEILYYKLKPLFDANSTYYVPVSAGNEKLRPLLTKAEVLSLIDDMPKSEDEIEVWSDNRRERREMYSQILKGDDQKALVQLISALYFRKQSSEANGKRFSSMDESAMKNAENLMLQEFGTVLDMTPDEVRKFIDERVQSS